MNTLLSDLRKIANAVGIEVGTDTGDSGGVTKKGIAGTAVVPAAGPEAGHGTQVEVSTVSDNNSEGQPPQTSKTINAGGVTGVTSGPVFDPNSINPVSTMPANTNTYSSNSNQSIDFSLGGGSQSSPQIGKYNGKAIQSDVSNVNQKVPSEQKLTDPFMKNNSLNLIMPSLALLGGGLYLNHKYKGAKKKATNRVVDHIPATLLAALASGTIGYVGNRAIKNYKNKGVEAGKELSAISARQQQLMTQMNRELMKRSSLSPSALAILIGAPALAYAGGKKIDSIAKKKTKGISNAMLLGGGILGGITGYGAAEVGDIYNAHKNISQLEELYKRVNRVRT